MTRRLWLSRPVQLGVVLGGLAAVWLAGGAPIWGGV